MALDTAARRYSAVNVGAPWRGPALFPDGAIETTDKQTLVGLYLGITVGGYLSLEPTTGTYVWTGNSATLTYSPVIDSGAKNRYSALNPMAVWRGQAAFPDGVSSTAKRRARLGLYGNLAAANNYSLTALYGEYAWTGNAATLTPTTNINTAQERLSAINIGNPWRGPATYPTGVGSRNKRYTLAGFYSEFTATYTYEITCNSGSYEWYGEPAFSDFEIGASAGSYAMTGGDITVLMTRVLGATSGSFAMTGNDTNLRVLVEKTLIPDAGSYAMTGNSVTFTRPRTLTAGSGQYFMVGTAMESWPGPGSGEKPAGRKRKHGDREQRRFEVEIDGEVFEAASEDEALAILDAAKAEAQANADKTVERATKAEKRPTRKILADARKSLTAPEIVAPDPIKTRADTVVAEIEAIYKEAMQLVEMAALLRKKEQEDEDEAIILMLV